MDKIPFEDGTLVKAGYVEIDGTKHETVQPEYTGKTPLSAYNLIKMQDNVENAINDGDLVRRVEISGNSVQEGTPSIESEAPIESVGDNINLFDISTITANKYIDLNNGNMSNSSVTSSSDYIEVKANKPYTISYDYETLQNTGNRAICLYNKDKTYLSGITYVISSTNKKATITPTQDGYMRFSYDNNFTNIKVVQGTSTGAYSPYGQGSVEIYNCNKNFLDLTKKPYHENSSVLNGAKVTLNGGVLNVDATNSTGAVTIRSIWADYKSSSTILLPKGTYYTALILNITGVESLNSKQVGGGTFTLEEDCYLTQWFFSVAQGNKSTKVLQIEKGETATEYVEHQSQTKALYTQQPFRGIGDVKDRFVKQNGVWYEEHEINHLVFNGTEKWGLDTTKEITQVYKYYNPSLFPQNKVTILSNCFIDKVPGDNEGITVGYGQIYIAVNKTTAPTLDDFKAKLTELYNAGTPVYVNYVLATPTLIPCTPEQVEVLNDIYSAYGEGMTNIICNDEIEPVIEIVKETKETVQSENDKAISALLARVTELEELVASLQNTAVEEGT